VYAVDEIRAAFNAIPHQDEGVDTWTEVEIEQFEQRWPTEAASASRSFAFVCRPTRQ
jgi:hypothetical protein